MKTSILSLLFIVTLLSSAPADASSGQFLGARPYFVATNAYTGELNGVGECEIHVKAGRSWFGHKTLEFKVISTVVGQNRTEEVQFPAISETELLERMQSSGAYRKSNESSISLNSIEVQKVDSRSGKEIWNVEIQSYNKLFFITGRTLDCQINIHQPEARPTYEIKTGERPQAL